MDPFQDDSQQAASTFDIGSILRAFWRRKWLFVVPTVLCLAMAGVVIKTMTPIYASRGTLLVKVDYIRSQLLMDAAQSYGVRQRDLARELHIELNTILTSPRFLQSVVHELGLDKAVKAAIEATGKETIEDSRALMIAERRLRKVIKLESSGPYMYDLEVRDTDPQRAFDMANFIMSRFVEEYRQERLSSRASTRKFLEDQKLQEEQKLAEAEKELADFMASMTSNQSLDPRINASSLAGIEEKLVRVQTKHDGPDAEEFDELATAARQILGRDPPAAQYARDGVIRSLLLELEDLGVDLMTTPETATAYQDLEIRLGRLRVQLNNRVDELVAANHPQAAVMERNRLTQYYYSYLYRTVELTVIRRVQDSIAAYREFLTRSPAESGRRDELQENVETQRDLVSTLQREITQMRMNIEAGMSDVGITVSVRRQPVFIPGPVEPDVMKLTFMAAVLSFGLGVGLVVLALFMDRSFRTVEEMEKYLGVKVIGTLPMVKDDHFERRRRLRVIRWVAIVLAVLAVAAVGFLVVYPQLNL